MPEVIDRDFAELVEKQTPIEATLGPTLDRIATSMVEQAAHVQPGQNVLLWFDPPGLPLVERLNDQCKQKGAQVTRFMRDLEKDAQEVAALPVEQVADHFKQEKALMDAADNILIVRGPANPQAIGTLDEPHASAYSKAYSDTHTRRTAGKVEWTLIYWPTKYEAEKEKMTYNDYFKMWAEACDQPWSEISKAQEFLVQKLDNAKKLELQANINDPDPNNRTKVEMNIEGMTFCNSTIDKNMPGSEVFSAPVKDSVNGQIYAKGEYEYNGHSMTNIHLKIVNGRITEESKAEIGDEHLQTILKNGEGARYFGEVALGTNPALNKRCFNGLLNEKVGGSFHMALGHCYTLPDYGGKLVNVNNGNTEDKTPNHWDLAILMHPSAGGGRVLVDDELIQKDGIFLADELQILNPKLSPEPATM